MAAVASASVAKPRSPHLTAYASGSPRPSSSTTPSAVADGARWPSVAHAMPPITATVAVAAASTRGSVPPAKIMLSTR